MDFFLEKMLAPVVAGLVVLTGQFFFQPLISRRTRTVESILKLKYEALEHAVGVVEKFYASADAAIATEEGARLLYQEVNHAYAKLMLYTEEPETLGLFKALMDSVTPFDRARFYTQVRRELGLSIEGMKDEMDVPYFVHEKFLPRETDGSID